MVLRPAYAKAVTADPVELLCMGNDPPFKNVEGCFPEVIAAVKARDQRGAEALTAKPMGSLARLGQWMRRKFGGWRRK